jgi:tRNA(Ile)-lysidine synthetase-like protein
VPSTSANVLEVLGARLAGWNPPRPWGVGYSGGRDSAVLLWALVQAGGPGSVVALHVDHGWRPAPEREAEALLAEAWCARLGVVLRRFGPPGEPVRSEADARRYRYRCFQTFVDEHPESPVFLAHHADDQAETLLLRLVQGRSWQGLGGIAPRRGPFLRPFLTLRRSTLAAVAADQSIPYHEDSTNAREAPARNYLRNRVLPLLEQRFPRTVPALGDFGRVWTALAPGTGVSPLWKAEGRGGWVEGRSWDDWSPLVRQAQLLAWASAAQPGVRLSRRFLEAVVEDGRVRGARGAGWVWTRSAQGVRWEPVVQGAPKEYLILVDRPGTWTVGSWVLAWDGPSGTGNLALPVVDPHRPWVWRSAVPGMRWTSADDGDWGRDRRRRRLGSLDPARCALVYQDGCLRAVVDPQTLRMVWSESGGEKLHKSGIFVTLRSVT